MKHPQDLPCAATALRKASRAITRLYDEALAPHGLTVTQFAILRNVARRGEVALPALADLMVMDRTSLYRTLTPMQRAGWIEVVSGRSGRAKLTHLTAAGEAIMDAAADDWARVQARVRQGLGGETWDALTASLARVVEVAGD